MSQRRATPLETVSVEVPEDALEAYEAALGSVCATVGFFLDDAAGTWRVEGVKKRGEGDADLAAALAVAEVVSGVAVPLARTATEAEGWLARTFAAFPEQHVGRRFAVRGTHLAAAPTPGRITLTLDAGLAFGSGEHGSTRGCLRAIEHVARRRRPSRLLDLGTGSGILALAAARLWRRDVLASDIDPWSVRVAAGNAAANGVGGAVRCLRGDGWHDPRLRRRGPFDLVFANILARPLCAMARDLGRNLAPGGEAILAGLLENQSRMVLAAHRRAGLVLAARFREGPWTALLLRKPSPARGEG